MNDDDDIDNDDDDIDEDEIQGILRDLYHDFNDIDAFAITNKKRSQVIRPTGFLGY